MGIGGIGSGRHGEYTNEYTRLREPPASRDLIISTYSHMITKLKRYGSRKEQVCLFPDSKVCGSKLITTRSNLSVCMYGSLVALRNFLERDKL